MAALTTQFIADSGVAPTPVAAAASDTAEIGNGHDTVIRYYNTDTNAKTITVVAPFTTDYGIANPDPTYTLAANTGKLEIPLRRGYDDGSGRATVNVTGTGGVTGVTVAVVRNS